MTLVKRLGNCRREILEPVKGRTCMEEERKKPVPSEKEGLEVKAWHHP